MFLRHAFPQEAPPLWATKSTGEEAAKKKAAKGGKDKGKDAKDGGKKGEKGGKVGLVCCSSS